MTGAFELQETGGVLDDEALEISLVNDLRELAGGAARIDAFCSARNLGPQVGYAVNLSVDEVLTNTISYGYDDDEPHRIELIVCMEADTIVVVMVDDSTAFDLSQAPGSDIESSIEARSLQGLGLFLVHQMMDRVEYRRVAECNVVTLTKNTTEGGTRNASNGA